MHSAMHSPMGRAPIMEMLNSNGVAKLQAQNSNGNGGNDPSLAGLVAIGIGRECALASVLGLDGQPLGLQQNVTLQRQSSSHTHGSHDSKGGDASGQTPANGVSFAATEAQAHTPTQASAQAQKNIYFPLSNNNTNLLGGSPFSSSFYNVPFAMQPQHQAQQQQQQQQAQQQMAQSNAFTFATPAPSMFTTCGTSGFFNNGAVFTQQQAQQGQPQPQLAFFAPANTNGVPPTSLGAYSQQQQQQMVQQQVQTANQQAQQTQQAQQSNFGPTHSMLQSQALQQLQAQQQQQQAQIQMNQITLQQFQMQQQAQAQQLQIQQQQQLHQLKQSLGMQNGLVASPTFMPIAPQPSAPIIIQMTPQPQPQQATQQTLLLASPSAQQPPIDTTPLPVKSDRKRKNLSISVASGVKSEAGAQKGASSATAAGAGGKATNANPLLSLLNASSTIKSSNSSNSSNGSQSSSGGSSHGKASAASSASASASASASGSGSAKRAKVGRSHGAGSAAGGHNSLDDSEYEEEAASAPSAGAGRPLAARQSSPFVPSASVAALIAASLEPEVHPSSGSVIYICRFAHCGDTFKTRFSLKRHLKKHSGEKPFACSYASCSKRFAEKSTLKRHVRIHTGEKPYKCSVAGCGKYFADRTNVKRHEMIHSGMRPYWCSYDGCSRGYFWRKHLRKHMQTVHRHEFNAPSEGEEEEEDEDESGVEEDDEDAGISRDDEGAQKGAAAAAAGTSAAAATSAPKRRPPSDAVV